MSEPMGKEGIQQMMLAKQEQQSPAIVSFHEPNFAKPPFPLFVLRPSFCYWTPATKLEAQQFSSPSEVLSTARFDRQYRWN